MRTCFLIWIAAAILITGSPIGAHAAEERCHDLNVSFHQAAIALDQWKLDHPDTQWWKTPQFTDQQKAYLAWETCFFAR
jgi:hypothetical protein